MSSFTFDKFTWSGDQNDRPHRVGLEVEGSVLAVATRKGLHQGNQLAAADPVVATRNGKHVWQVRVLDSFHNWGDGLVIGAMDGQAKLNEPKGTKAWGLHIFSGCAACSKCALGSAPAQLLCLLRAHLMALGGVGTPRERPFH